MNFQDIIRKLDDYWKAYGCILMHPYTSELGAGTLHPATSISILSGKDNMVAYVQPVIRPSDGRYGKNPNRLYQHHQYQVIIQPSRSTLLDDYLLSLEAIGLSKNDFDVRFIEDDWENPSIGAFGFGWEVSCNGMEITQFTYMQQVGGIECQTIPGEIAYGIERIAMVLQEVDNVYDLKWDETGIKYGEIFLDREREFSTLSFEYYDVDFLISRFENSERMCATMVEKNLPIAGYDFCIQASHVLNLLESRGVVGVNERASYILRVRKMANMCCDSYIKLYRVA
ncbi:glycine--tRNA ligase subunit alpha [Anaplasma capra]|uniref:glycine--tRNA ligase subunit alpha n=1 Tax=Anaplasma capra TaxID=1562740 RepID=UPI0021D59BFC|nr:glycine--tRNA ligase subunit alpha [Anaplasma capra]MCU7611184.1 glycine--tRNA ligase subunit alpha [Anaplasma capra]MCU7612312.1 glycine--tRNA ligase subunit alpha [Anaplasma capra]